MTQAFQPSPAAIAAGADNLLIAGAGVRSGERVLIVVEPAGVGHYADGLADYLVAAADRIGAHAEVLTVPLTSGPETAPAGLLTAIEAAQRTVFLHRLGDQLRFRPVPGSGTKLVSYTLDPDYLAADFGRTPAALFQEVHDRILELLSGARRYSIRCANGSRATMKLRRAHSIQVTPFTVGNFPVMIIPPIDAAGLNGRLVFTHALTSTGIHDFPGAEVPLATPVTVVVESGRIVEIGGEPALVSRIEAHFERIGGLFGGDRRALFSWHTGINPTTFFRGRAEDAPGRWSGVAFGSPRYSHFHLCGEAPGEVSAAIFDATIMFDDRIIWQNGQLVAFSPTEIQELAARHGVDPAILTTRREIGISL